ncbi:hypothetical protein V6N11_066078 [Hibiscus sabdariffa]|uniref:Uncharacterized protein n=1 Tax=Hibiscus sabdariffa TaxID=183260 RepID=A0ABR2NUW1_9ROSI
MEHPLASVDGCIGTLWVTKICCDPELFICSCSKSNSGINRVTLFKKQLDQPGAYVAGPSCHAHGSFISVYLPMSLSDSSSDE